MAATHPWWLLIHSGCSSIRNCAILKGNSSCGLYDENHVISNHNHIGGAILPRSILHYATKHLHFATEYFVWLSNRAMMIITNKPAHIVIRQVVDGT